MNNQATDTLVDRVERLEQQNRRLKLGGVACLAVVGTVLLMGQAAAPKVSDEIRTRQLVVVDETGETRAVLRGTADASQFLLYASGVPQVVIQASLAGPGLNILRDGKGVVLEADEKGAALTFRDGAVERARLSTVSPGPTLSLNDDEGKARSVLRVTRGESRFDLLDSQTEPRVSLILNGVWSQLRMTNARTANEADITVQPHVGSWLTLIDESGGQARLYGAPTLMLIDSEDHKTVLGKMRPVTFEDIPPPYETAASLIMFEKGKGVIWRAP